ncbi:PRTRC system protein B [Mucilaginibacter robiniae]|uniref:PRTRC system protein B n=1 Tax=Mucilaginibacter robiniae TaxID=2728022 RepID=A0A7L5E2Z9_9SPHI|nr:PRTRC system protein B [Mucilaginibacter robiniae]QJD96024.1 PRTRC system protein B [Mucilaginibacter robiniae]
MENITAGFGTLYHPVKALLIYKKAGHETDYYVEGYDMDSAGRPINGHPLSVRESSALAKALTVNERKAQGFLTPEGLMPAQVLHIHSSPDGCVLWHTPPQVRRLLFAEALGITSGTAHVPAMLWRADRRRLQVFAVKDETITLETALYRAPFFNVYADGAVCMGNVRVQIPGDCGLERFLQLWEEYFFNSFFSHTIGGDSLIKGNIVQLWQQLTATQKPFPEVQLLPAHFTLQHLIL